MNDKILEHIEKVLSLKSAKFDESFDVSVYLGYESVKKFTKPIRTFCILPNGDGRKRKILALVNPEHVKDAEEAGAEFSGLEYIEKVKNGWMDFNTVIATNDVMSKLGQIGMILGRKGLMPNVKSGNLVKENDIINTISNFKNGKILILRNNKYGVINFSIGKSSYNSSQIKDNLLKSLNEILNNKPDNSKGSLIKSVSLSLTMSKGSVNLSLSEIGNALRGFNG